MEVKVVNMSDVYMTNKSFERAYKQMRHVVNSNATALKFVAIGSLLTLWLVHDLKKEIDRLRLQVYILGQKDKNSEEMS